MDKKLESICGRLAKWYPEHKVYAMDSIDSTLRESCAAYAKEHDTTVEELLKSLGYEMISGDEVYALRGPAKYVPGEEPEVIRGKIDSVLRRLDEAYPDKKIAGSVMNQHKNLAKDMSGVYQWLGYKTTADFLVAYGYDYSGGAAGRPKSTDPEAVIRALQEKYPNGSPFCSAEELFAGTEYESKLKTIKNSSQAAFGMSFGKYLLSIGLIQRRESHKTEKPKPEKKQKYIICKVLPTAGKTPVYCIAESKAIHEGDNVEFPMGKYEWPVFGAVQEVVTCEEDSAPCDVSDAKTITRKLNITDYKTGLLSTLLHVNAAESTDEIINGFASENFLEMEAVPAETIGKASWAICRGLASEVIRVLDCLIAVDDQTYGYYDLILSEPGVSELFIYGSDITDVLKNYPGLKIAMFAEEKQSGKAHLCYSQSGYSYVTDTYEIGQYDLVGKAPWTVRHSPIENFQDHDIHYTFRYREDWDALNYVYMDINGIRRQLGK